MTGGDFKSLLDLAVPVLGTFGAGDGTSQGAFIQALNQGRQLAREEKARKAQADDIKSRQAAGFLMDLGTHASGIDDPAAMADFLTTARHAYEKAGYGPASDVPAYTVPESKIAAKRYKQIKSALDALAGYDLDQLAQSGAHVRLDDGTDVPIGAALDLTNARPFDKAGKAIPKPKKIDTNAGTEEERWLAKRAKDYGYDSLSDVDADTQLNWRNEFRGSGKDTKLDAGPAGQLTDLLDIWKAQHPGQEPSAAVRAQLREQANRVNDKPTGSGGITPDDMRGFAISEKLAKTWQDATKSQREMQRQFGIMQSGLKRFNAGDKNGGSQAVLVTFQKILDPSSVVRESEYARSAAGVSLLDRIEGYKDRLLSGGAGVPASDLAAMVETARQFLANMESFNQGTRKRLELQTKKYKIDPSLVFDDVATGESAPPRSGNRVYYDANGRPR